MAYVGFDFDEVMHGKAVADVRRALTPYVLGIRSADDCLTIAMALHGTTLEVLCAAIDEDDQQHAITLIMATTQTLYEYVKDNVDRSRADIEAATVVVRGHA
jgi:hypothetical protein